MKLLKIFHHKYQGGFKNEAFLNPIVTFNQFNFANGFDRPFV